MNLPFVAALTFVSVALIGCSSIQRYSDCPRRQIRYERQLAEARRGGTRADVHSAFPSPKLTAQPLLLSGIPWSGHEYYRLDSDFVLEVAFLYVDSRFTYEPGSNPKQRLGKPPQTIDDLLFGRTTPKIHHSPKDFLVGSGIHRIPAKPVGDSRIPW
jgi:hypothetical protein